MLAADLDTSRLFTPFTVRNLVLRNRFVVPSMQRGVSDGGMPTADLAAYYRRRAEGGFALIMSESCAIDHPSAGGKQGCVRMASHTKEAWRHCVEGVVGAGGQMFIQLWHEGAMRQEMNGADEAKPTLSPSGLVTGVKPNGKALTARDMDEIKESYVRGALMSQEVGAAGVELHAAHGFFLDQFLWAETNIRTDGYGGESIAQRVRFPAEVVSAIRQATGENFVISFRFSQWKETDYHTARIVNSPAELGVMLTKLRAAGVDIFHASTRRFHTPEWPNSQLGLAGWTKALTDAAVLTVGSVGGKDEVLESFKGIDTTDTPAIVSSIAELIRRFDRQEFDLVAVGRASIGDPDWVNKVAVGRYQDIRRFSLKDLLTVLAAYDTEFNKGLYG